MFKIRSNSSNISYQEFKKVSFLLCAQISSTKPILNTITNLLWIHELLKPGNVKSAASEQTITSGPESVYPGSQLRETEVPGG